ncbi:hypothetical protein VSK92_17280 [Bacillus swezeyi]
MKKKAIYASLLFLILVIGFYIYNAFNGNPISRSLAEKKTGGVFAGNTPW